jgi:hypothetical protein
MANTVSFAKDIVPLFTSGDIACMGRRGILLNQYSYMAVPANAQNVLNHLDGSAPPQMPPSGPWPGSQIQLFKDWIAGGYQQ